MAERDFEPEGKPRQRDLTQGPITKTLVAFALPTLGSSVLQSLNGSINAAWVGHYLGEGALAATSNANITMFLLLAFVCGFGLASTIPSGLAFGRRVVGGARRVLGTAVGSFTVIALLLSVLGWIFAPQLLDLLGTPGDARGLALTYMRVIFISMPGSLMLILLMTALRGGGDSVTPLWFMILSVVLDSGLNPFFIAGIGPFPRLGIAGAATATVIANTTALLGLLTYMYARDLPLRLKGKELRYLWPDFTLLKTLIAKGLPMGLQMIVVSASGLALLGLVNREGVATAAAFGVAMQLWTYIQMPAMAVGAAVSSMAAQNIGAGAWDRVGKITRSGVLTTLAVTAVMVTLLIVADRTALGLFLGQGTEAMAIAQHIQLLATWSFLMFGVTMVLFSTVRANGAVFAPLIILLVGLVPVRLGFAVLARPALGADALWLSLPVSTVVNLGLAVLYYKKGGWRQARMVEQPSRTELIEEANSDCEPGGRIMPAA
jgi:putative MATE family efflux protein